MEANVSRGHLEVHDDQGSYRIPVGRRTRKCLMILDQKEGEYIRSLELDLFTGYVYYCVDNATSGGLSYYYDMSSKKVGHYFIHRYLRLARNHGFTASPEEYEVFEKLPCADWVNEMGKLPGWKEAIENRVQGLLLPWTEVVKVPAEKIPAEPSGDPENMLSKTASVSFFRAPAAYPAKEKEYRFLFKKAGEENLILYRNDTIGNAFFGEDEEFERILSDTESAWLGSMLSCAAAGTLEEPYAAFMSAVEGALTPEAVCRLFPQGQELVLQRAVFYYADGSSEEITADLPAQLQRADILQTSLQGLLHREIQLV